MTSARPSQRFTPNPEQELVQKHAELVKRIAHHLAARLPSSVDVDDLIQAGVIGLLDAARNYSGDRGASFETYAGIRIRGAMVDELRRGDWAPRSVHRRLREITAAIRELEQQKGKAPKDAEVAAHLGLPLDEYHAAVQDAARCQVLSMDMHEGEDDGFDAPDASAGPLDLLQHSEFREVLAESIACLPEREKLVMSLYYDEELNLKEIGQVLEVTESRVCQLHGQALLRLRAKLELWRGREHEFTQEFT